MPIISQREVSTGLNYPPRREVTRFSRMNDNYRLSMGDFGKLLGEEQTNRLKPNLFNWLMNFWIDVCLNDAPVINYPESVRVEEFINAMENALMEASRRVVGDMVRYGVGVFVNRRAGQPESVDPRWWMPIRAAEDDNLSMGDIIGYPYIQSTTESVPDHFLRLWFHDGVMERSVYTYAGTTLQTRVSVEETPSATNPVVPVRLNEGFYGRSEYDDVKEYISELSRRETAVSSSLDNQANPHLALPEGVFTTDAAGRVAVAKEGMVIPVPEGARPPEYITWDPSFASQSEAIERANNRIYQMAQVSRVLVDPSISSQLPSGAALRRLAIPTVNRIRTIRRSLSDALRDVIVGAAELSGKAGGEVLTIDPAGIQIQWAPELSSGLTDEADSLTALTEAGLLDKALALQLITSTSREEAERSVKDAEQTREANNVGSQGDNLRRGRNA